MFSHFQACFFCFQILSEITSNYLWFFNGDFEHDYTFVCGWKKMEKGKSWLSWDWLFIHPWFDMFGLLLCATYHRKCPRNWNATLKSMLKERNEKFMARLFSLFGLLKIPTINWSWMDAEKKLCTFISGAWDCRLPHLARLWGFEHESNSTMERS